MVVNCDAPLCCVAGHDCVVAQQGGRVFADRSIEPDKILGQELIQPAWKIAGQTEGTGGSTLEAWQLQFWRGEQEE
jgi:hypothetical protein